MLFAFYAAYLNYRSINKRPANPPPAYTPAPPPPPPPPPPAYIPTGPAPDNATPRVNISFASPRRVSRDGDIELYDLPPVPPPSRRQNSLSGTIESVLEDIPLSPGPGAKRDTERREDEGDWDGDLAVRQWDSVVDPFMDPRNVVEDEGEGDPFGDSVDGCGDGGRADELDREGEESGGIEDGERKSGEGKRNGEEAKKCAV
ncbi:hypothetical protein P280DRAFT_485786 [Massarina eburnea CBS 473.64]|uniref:Uncharacterized protein n=1 Tax=Massarina eburnea CBS 473.64 TaxID=1395130 RepID=A0A6A6RI03_9PLEO|nr:hypothetical protein P280DRAFT_485786 [Massarina eburnea CBS 473.64]